MGQSVLPAPLCLFPSPNWGSFLTLFFSSKFSISCSSSSPSQTPMIQILVHLKFSQRFLSLSSIFEFLSLLSILVECLFLPFIPNCWFESLPPSFNYWFPVYFSLFHLVYPLFLPLFCGFTQWGLWASWSTVFWTLHWWVGYFCFVSSFSETLFCSFIWTIFLCLLNLATTLCFFLCIKESYFYSLSQHGLHSKISCKLFRAET